MLEIPREEIVNDRHPGNPHYRLAGPVIQYLHNALLENGCPEQISTEFLNAFNDLRDFDNIINSNLGNSFESDNGYFRYNNQREIFELNWYDKTEIPGHELDSRPREASAARGFGIPVEDYLQSQPAERLNHPQHLDRKKREQEKEIPVKETPVKKRPRRQLIRIRDMKK